MQFSIKAIFLNLKYLVWLEQNQRPLDVLTNAVARTKVQHYQHFPGLCIVTSFLGETDVGGGGA